ncbi:tyrosine-type recombinase/integrase [Vibrio fortis]|uniref:tyrosine-type recombinase/integrase n=1 Tax=Vibrio fortis TaxID=212667 RepID=UPI003EBF9465
MFIKGFFRFWRVLPQLRGLTQSMYIFKSASGVYYTRLCLPKSLKNSGFPFDVKLSLYTKDRLIAMDRGIEALSVLRPIIRSTTPNTCIREFQERIGKAISSLRSDLNIPTNQTISLLTETRKTQPPEKSNLKPKAREKILPLLASFIASKRLENISELSIHQLEQRSKHFITSCNITYLDEVTSSIAMQYRDILLSEQRSHKTNQFYLSSIKQFLGWCIATEHLDKQPFEYIKLPKTKSTKEQRSRPRWTKAQLKKVFTHDTFDNSNEQLKWALLMMAYHGCRPSEVCQLTVSDICMKEKTLTISDSAVNQSVKNSYSRRVIPLHSLFHESSFKDYVDKRHQAKKAQLFDFKVWGSGTFSKPLTVAFGRLLTRKGFHVGERPTAYSFRHTFIDELKKQNISEHIVAQLVGHSHSSLTFGHYGKTASVELLRPHIEKITYLELEWMLY